MKLLKKVRLTHSLIAINVLMAFFSAWSFSKPSKTWQVSKSSESRFIASEESAPELESFEEMKTISADCKDKKIDTNARYVRLSLGQCFQGEKRKWHIINNATGSKANVLKHNQFISTDFIFLQNGLNKISFQSLDENNNSHEFELAFHFQETAQ